MSGTLHVGNRLMVVSREMTSMQGCINGWDHVVRSYQEMTQFCKVVSCNLNCWNKTDASSPNRRQPIPLKAPLCTRSPCTSSQILPCSRCTTTVAIAPSSRQESPYPRACSLTTYRRPLRAWYSRFRVAYHRRYRTASRVRPCRDQGGPVSHRLMQPSPMYRICWIQIMVKISLLTLTYSQILLHFLPDFWSIRYSTV